MKKILYPFLVLLVFLAFSFNKSKKVVVIDAGHGGSDSGAQLENSKEKDIVLAIAKQIKLQNSDENLDIHFTREKDDYPSLTDRIALINNLKPDLVISLHANFTPKNSDRKGVEIYTQNTEASQKIASQLASQFSNPLISQQNLYLLKNSEFPAILVEVGFLSNPEDRAYLSNTNGQKEIAQRILEGIRK